MRLKLFLRPSSAMDATSIHAIHKVQPHQTSTEQCRHSNSSRHVQKNHAPDQHLDTSAGRILRRQSPQVRDPLTHMGRGRDLLQDFFYCQKQVPPRWGWVYLEGELAKLKSTSRYDKILNSCRIAKRDHHDWIWIDTCCIDKTSSAELSDAINSMYDWYANADICYAFLADVSSISPEL